MSKFTCCNLQYLILVEFLSKMAKFLNFLLFLSAVDNSESYNNNKVVIVSFTSKLSRNLHNHKNGLMDLGNLKLFQHYLALYKLALLEVNRRTKNRRIFT